MPRIRRTTEILPPYLLVRDFEGRDAILPGYDIPEVACMPLLVLRGAVGLVRGVEVGACVSTEM
jgi:hypothetical protein